jgi:hypothetical protein
VLYLTKEWWCLAIRLGAKVVNLLAIEKTHANRTEVEQSVSSVLHRGTAHQYMHALAVLHKYRVLYRQPYDMTLALAEHIKQRTCR